MKCPSCSYKETKVIDSRINTDGSSIRRRRECLKCEKRFTTYEYIEQVPLMVVKKDGRRQAFYRTKIIAGLVKACEKRPVPHEKIIKVVNEIEAELRTRKSPEIKSREIGELVMKKLRDLDEVAYVRFASVYKRFRDIEDFKKEIKGLG